MKEFIEILKDIESDSYNEIIAILEAQKEVLEDVLAEIAREQVPQFIENRNFSRAEELVEKAKKIDKKIEDVEVFLEVDLDEEDSENDEENEAEDEAGTEEDEYDLTGLNGHPLSQSFTNKKPRVLSIDGYKIYSKSWKGLLVKTCKYLIEKDEKTFDDFIEKKEGNIKIYLTDFKKPEELKLMDGGKEKTFSSNRVAKTIKELLRAYKIKLTKTRVYLKKDFDKRDKKN